MGVGDDMERDRGWDGIGDGMGWDGRDGKDMMGGMGWEV